MPRPLRIALLIETSREAGRAMLRGIAAYARAQGHWQLFHHERTLREAAPPWLRRWRGDGIIARIESPRLAREIQRQGLPTVDLRCSFVLPGVPRVSNDQAAIARLAADHLLDRGFRHFAYCGLPGIDYADERGRHFADALARQGVEVQVYGGGGRLRGGTAYAVEGRALTDEAALAAWVRSLPRPVGVLACNDSRARHVLGACGRCGAHVPDEVAILGIGNDEVECELCHPPLSSVRSDSRRIGFLAASVLDRLLHGRPPPRGDLLVPPLGVAARGSTDVVAVADAETAAAVRFIRERACDGIRVEDVLEIVPVSRSTLERRFLRHLGRTPKAEVLRVQLGRVKDLLAATDSSLAEIADRTGFSDVSNMCHAFRREEGQTPGAYRHARRGKMAKSST
jgi:LacI family transcriptional regulator